MLFKTVLYNIHKVSFVNLLKQKERTSKSNTFAKFYLKEIPNIVQIRRSFCIVSDFRTILPSHYDILSIARKKSRDLFKPKTRAWLFTKFFHLHETKSNHFETLEANLL